MKKIELQLFGAARELSTQDRLELAIPLGSTIADLRPLLNSRYVDNQRALSIIAASLFATDQLALRDSDPLPIDGKLAILPPVCGG